MTNSERSGSECGNAIILFSCAQSWETQQHALTWGWVQTEPNSSLLLRSILGAAAVVRTFCRKSYLKVIPKKRLHAETTLPVTVPRELEPVCLQSTEMENLCWRRGPEPGPEQVGKGKWRFCSQGRVSCQAGVHTVTVRGMGRQTLLHCSSSLLPPSPTNPINQGLPHLTCHSLVGPGEPLSALTQG